MNPRTPAINPYSACELLAQEMGAQLVVNDTLPECFAELNAQRLDLHWPFVTSMSCFNPIIVPPSSEPLNMDLKPLRAYWEKGLTLIMKHDRHQGVSHMLACCKPLSELPSEHILCQLSRVMLRLLPCMGLNDVDVLIALAGRFDHVLRDADHLALFPAENLLRDSLFYLSLKKPDENPHAWELNAVGIASLQLRLRWYAKQLSHLLYPTEDTDKIDKTLIERYLVPITDALLFLNEIQLRTRLMLRMTKIEPRMLKIAVPIQLLMGEALRLG